MAVDINVVVLVGRLTRDCDVSSTPQGTSVCRFSVAVNRRKRTGDNSWGDEVSYFDIVLWGKSAETLRKYLTKGRQVSIEGELRQNRWEKDGQNHSKVEVIANNVQLLGGGAQGADGPQGQVTPDNRNQASSQDFGSPESFDDSYVPF